MPGRGSQPRGGNAASNRRIVPRTRRPAASIRKAGGFHCCLGVTPPSAVERIRRWIEPDGQRVWWEQPQAASGAAAEIQRAAARASRNPLAPATHSPPFREGAEAVVDPWNLLDAAHAGYFSALVTRFSRRSFQTVTGCLLQCNTVNDPEAPRFGQPVVSSSRAGTRSKPGRRDVSGGNCSMCRRALDTVCKPAPFGSLPEPKNVKAPQAKHL